MWLKSEIRNKRGKKRKRTWTSIRVYDSDSFLACAVLEEPLFGAVVTCAGESGKVVDDWDFLLCCLWGKVEVQCHFATSGGGMVS